VTASAVAEGGFGSYLAGKLKERTTSKQVKKNKKKRKKIKTLYCN
jgi:hypothetical protein